MKRIGAILVFATVLLLAELLTYIILTNGLNPVPAAHPVLSYLTAFIIASLVYLVGFSFLRWLRRLLWEFPEQRLAPWREKLLNSDVKGYLDSEQSLRNSLIQLLLSVGQAVTVTVLLAGIYFTWANLNETREGNITDRFIRNVAELAAAAGGEKDSELETRVSRDDPSVDISSDGIEPEVADTNMLARLAGIYGLERIARTSTKDYESVMDLLSMYVRVHAPAHDSDDLPETWPDHPKRDIEAVLRILRHYKRPEAGSKLDLSHSDLRLADLTNATFDGSWLQGSHFERANLSGAHFEGADLSHASFAYARLDGAFFDEHSVLDGVNFESAYLCRADLRRTPILNSIGLTKEQLKCARIGSEAIKQALAHPAVLEVNPPRSAPILDSSNASLSETEEWLERRMPEFGEHVNLLHTGLVSFSLDRVAVGKCRLEWTQNMKDEGNRYLRRERVSVRLKTLDPSRTAVWSFERPAIDWDLEINSGDKNISVNQEFFDLAGHSDTNRSPFRGSAKSWQIAFRTREQATRVAQALNHAIYKCGGKPELF